MSDFNLKVTVRNARLLDAIREVYGSAAELSRQMGESQSAVGNLVTMRTKPYNDKGWTRLAQDVSAMLSKRPEDLWPEHLREVQLQKSSAEMVLNLDAMRNLSVETSDEVRLSQVKVLSQFTSELTPKQQYIITSRFFANATHREIATHLDISAPRVMQLERIALKKMRKVAVESGYLRRSTAPEHWDSFYHEGYGLKEQAFEILSK